MNTASFFSPDYFAARQRFRRAVARLGWDVETYPVDVTGPGGEELTVDAAVGPGDDSDAVLVVSSGLHGVEGFFGSAVQLHLLERWAECPELRPPFRAVFVHALDPYGFAWLRRVDENNVDLNRNFLLPGERFEGSPPLYPRLDPVLNPKRPPAWWDWFIPRAVWSIARHGMPALKHAIASGQYDFPKGLFFGGKEPAQVRKRVAEHFGRWLGGARRVVHLDFHTGLGGWATYKLIVDTPLTDGRRRRLAAWYRPEVIEEGDKPQVAYSTRGGFGPWCAAQKPDWDYLPICAEFGTYPALRVLSALRAENQAHFWGAPGSSAVRRAKRGLKEAFCPASERWRRAVLRHSLDVVRRGVAGLAEESPARVAVG